MLSKVDCLLEKRSNAVVESCIAAEKRELRDDVWGIKFKDGVKRRLFYAFAVGQTDGYEQSPVVFRQVSETTRMRRRR